VLWFDESYDEARFRFVSTLRATEEASLVVVIGTSGATHLPMLVVQRAIHRAVPLLIVNRDPSVFSDMANESPQGHFIQGTAAQVLPDLVQGILRHAHIATLTR
jgi:NAD-dependent deacetylase